MDIGCGDLKFWEGRECRRYFGLDLSETIVKRNRMQRTNWRFQVGDASRHIAKLRGRVVFCLDMLFHVMDDGVFVKILDNLACYSDEWIFIYNWHTNPFNLKWRLQRLYAALADDASENVYRPSRVTYLNVLLAVVKRERIRDMIIFLPQRSDSDGIYEKYRLLEDYASRFQRRGFELVAKHRNPNRGELGAMYVFQKQSTPLRPPEPSAGSAKHDAVTMIVSPNMTVRLNFKGDELIAFD